MYYDNFHVTATVSGQSFELLGAVELLAHGIGQRRVLVENPPVQLIRPLLLGRRAPNRGVRARHWALACSV